MSGTSTKPTEAYLSGAIFAPDVEPPVDVAIFEGFLLRDDVTVWLGREKHRNTHHQNPSAFGTTYNLN